MTLVTGAIWHIARDRSKHRNSMGVLGGVFGVGEWGAKGLHFSGPDLFIYKCIFFEQLKRTDQFPLRMTLKTLQVTLR